MPDPQPSLRCCVCHETRAKPWRIAPDNLLGGDARYRAVRCVRCGTARLDPRPPASETGRFYAPDTYARAEGEATTNEVGRRLDLYNRGLALRAHSDARGTGSDPKRVLDVGCGDGRFLAAMAALGWEAEGLETDVVAAGLARRRARAVIHEAPLEALDLPAAAYDLVTLLHVLEHVPDPRGTLAAVRRVLRPGGTLLLALPHVGSLEAALFGSAWYHLDLPRHLWGFTPHALTRLLEESGFAVGSVRYLPFLFAPQSVRSALRRRARPRAGARPAEAGGALVTRAFGALLKLSERSGRTLPGEIMELAAVRPPEATP